MFGVRSSLVADWVNQPDGGFTLDFEFVLNPETVTTTAPSPKRTQTA